MRRSRCARMGGVDGIVYLLFASRRGLLLGARAAIDFLAAALKSSVEP